MPAAPSPLAITACLLAFTSKIEITKSLKEGDPVLTNDDEFSAGDVYDPTFEISGEGKGDADASIAAASEALDDIAGVSGGKTMVDQLDTTQRTDGRNGWSFHAMHFPSAA